ncbi:ATP-binding cassette domain-containing protein [Desulfobulbus rhabdoformis]|uniref:ABC transporter ATP-binding protein n=1 Tax=Desulfobulbus rhabdoformis TaxID=34032 RepID=UPI001966CDCD|nr:ATP-binding cassette domain-containing protein [Desulfobulbus rhabdoformis]MBM9614990.1 ATP-binding cassette domain-containing protein [Desulfobulbus rhabdoformis]
MIQVEHLTRTYGTTRAVDDVSFSIGSGEIVGLLGHNGAGKTTIMKMLTGYLEASGGTIKVDGMPIESNRSAIQALIGYLPENCPVYPEMSVIGYLEYIAALHGIDERDMGHLLLEALERTGLTERATQSIGTLSRGYRQRVGVAQAILHRPSIIILDEPTNGLDPTQIQHMRTLIRELAKDATLIISTHILQEVQAVCDRVIIIGHGKKMLDTSLSALSDSQRLLVTTDRAEAEATLASLDGVTAVEQISVQADRYCYGISTTVPAKEVAPFVASAITGQGWSLFELTLESRNLERVFSEINLAGGREQ